MASCTPDNLTTRCSFLFGTFQLESYALDQEGLFTVTLQLNKQQRLPNDGVVGMGLPLLGQEYLSKRLWKWSCNVEEVEGFYQPKW